MPQNVEQFMHELSFEQQQTLMFQLQSLIDTNKALTDEVARLREVIRKNQRKQQWQSQN